MSKHDYKIHVLVERRPEGANNQDYGPYYDADEYLTGYGFDVKAALKAMGQDVEEGTFCYDDGEDWEDEDE